MKKISLLLILMNSSFILAQAPTVQWQRSLGGTNLEKANTIIQTTDGGYIAGGYTRSNDGDVTGYQGLNDCWIVKMDASGGLVWQKTFGGSGNEGITSVQQTADGGYIVAASTTSQDGDVTDNHGGGDMWILKLDALGNVIWKKAFGGTSNDDAQSIRQTADGGYVVAGTASSFDGDVTGQHGGADAWVVKLDSAGTLVWQNTLGGNSLDISDDIRQTADGGYIVAASTSSENNGDVTEMHGVTDYWIVKLNSAGTIVWQKAFGGTNSERAYSISQSIDGGYIVAGSTTSNDGDITVNYGTNDCWVVKLNATGDLVWQKSLGGTAVDLARDIFQNIDGSYIVAGYSASTDGDVTGNHGNKDAWAAKLNSTGGLIWQKSYGGTDLDESYCMESTDDGHFILAGNSLSNDGDVSGNHGNADYWIVKMGPVLSNDTFLLENVITIYPNPVDDNLILKINYFEPSQEITISDISGKVIHSQKVNGLITTLDTSYLSDGVYFLTLVNGAKTMTQKFVKK